jgi:hypothetical protein
VWRSLCYRERRGLADCSLNETMWPQLVILRSNGNRQVSCRCLDGHGHAINYTRVSRPCLVQIQHREIAGVSTLTIFPLPRNMSSPIKLVLYIDVVSPWTYVAYTVLQRYKKPWNLDLVSLEESDSPRAGPTLTHPLLVNFCSISSQSTWAMS